MIFKTAVSLLFVATALHVRAAPPVPAAPPLPVGVAVNIVDFQGNVFDINGRLTAPLTAISTLNHKPGEPAQAWSLSGPTGGTSFTVVSLSAGTFMSYTTAAVGGGAGKTQLCGQTVPTVWNIIPSSNGVGYNIIESKSRQAVMSWLHSNSTIVTPTTPLTLEVFDPNEAQQIFGFVGFI